jgi:DNA-binding LacI/PurR family transcriptional regulator
VANNFSPETSPESTTKINKRPTISDIARAAGVSIAVVSYALNGKPGVSPATRDRVLRIANEYGWRPSAAARSLRTSPKTVGLALVEGDSASTHSTHFIEFLAGVQEALATKQLSLTVHLVDTAQHAADLLATWWAERRFDAFLLTDVQSDDPRIATITKFSIPAVAVAHPQATHGTPCVA